MKLYGWICPLCEQVWAPHMPQCDCKEVAAIKAVPLPNIPPGVVSADPTAWEREQAEREEKAQMGIPPNTEVFFDE